MKRTFSSFGQWQGGSVIQWLYICSDDEENGDESLSWFLEKQHHLGLEQAGCCPQMFTARKLTNLTQSIEDAFNPSVTQGDLNEINGADGRLFKFMEVKLHLFLLIPIKQAKIVRFLLNFHQNGDKGTL